MVAEPVDYKREHQRGEAYRLEDGDEGIVTEIAHDGTVHPKPDEQGDRDDWSTGEKPKVGTNRVDEVFDAEAHNK